MFWIMPIPTHRRTWGILVLIVAAILTIAAVAADILNLIGTNTILRMDEMDGEEITTETNYYIPNLYLIDAYAVNDDDDSYYFLCGFYDKNDKLWVAHMKIGPYDDMYQDALDYLDYGVLGDFDQPCYVLTSSAPTEDDLRGYSADAVKYYEEEGLLSRDMVLDVELDTVYDPQMTMEEAMREQRKNDVTVAFVLNILAVLVGAVGILLLRSDRKQAPVRKEDRFNTRW